MGFVDTPSACDEPFAAVQDQGETIPQEVVNVYVCELQSSSPTFSRFTLEELSFLQDSAAIRSYDAGHLLLKEGEPACCIAIILQGSVTVHSNEGDEVREFGKGDVIGHKEFFHSRPGHMLQQKQNVKLTGTVNLLALLSYKMLDDMQSEHHGVGHRLIQALAETATIGACEEQNHVRNAARPRQIDCVHPEAINKFGLDRPQLRSMMILRADSPECSMLADVTPAEIDVVLDHALLIRYSAGDQVFQAGIRSKWVSFLVVGNLEGHATQAGRPTVGSSGDMFGEEAMLPYIPPRQCDMFAGAGGCKLLVLRPGCLRDINKDNPGLGGKILRNITRTGLKRMTEKSREEVSAVDSAELTELRRVYGPGLQEVLRAANQASQGGESLGYVEDKFENLQGEAALKSLIGILSGMDRKINGQPDLEPLIQQHTQKIFELRQVIKTKDNKIETVEYQRKEVEHKCSVLEGQLEARVKDVETMKGHVKEEENRFKEIAKRLRKRNSAVEQITTHSDQDLSKIMKQQTMELKELQEKLARSEEQHQAVISSLTADKNRLEKEANQHAQQVERLVQRLEGQGGRGGESGEGSQVEEKSDGDEDDEEIMDETIPRLQKELARVRWKCLLLCLDYKHRNKEVICELMGTIKYLRGHTERLKKSLKGRVGLGEDDEDQGSDRQISSQKPLPVASLNPTPVTASQIGRSISGDKQNLIDSMFPVLEDRRATFAGISNSPLPTGSLTSRENIRHSSDSCPSPRDDGLRKSGSMRSHRQSLGEIASKNRNRTSSLAVRHGIQHSDGSTSMPNSPTLRTKIAQFEADLENQGVGRSRSQNAGSSEADTPRLFSPLRSSRKALDRRSSGFKMVTVDKEPSLTNLGSQTDRLARSRSTPIRNQTPSISGLDFRNTAGNQTARASISNGSERISDEGETPPDSPKTSGERKMRTSDPGQKSGQRRLQTVSDPNRSSLFRSVQSCNNLNDETDGAWTLKSDPNLIMEINGYGTNDLGPKGDSFDSFDNGSIDGQTSTELARWSRSTVDSKQGFTAHPMQSFDSKHGSTDLSEQRFPDVTSSRGSRTYRMSDPGKRYGPTSSDGSNTARGTSFLSRIEASLVQT